MNNRIVNIVKHWYCSSFSLNSDISMHGSSRLFFDKYLTKLAVDSHSSPCSQLAINSSWSNLDFVISKSCIYAVCRCKHIDSLTRRHCLHRSYHVLLHFRIMISFRRLSLMQTRFGPQSTCWESLKPNVSLSLSWKTAIEVICVESSSLSSLIIIQHRFDFDFDERKSFEAICDASS